MSEEDAQATKSMYLDPAEQAARLKAQQDYRYNPEHALHKVGFVQEQILDAVMGMDMQELLYKPKIMENVNALMNNMNGTAVQVTRNAIVESNSNLGALADAVVDRLAATGTKLIKTVQDTGGTKGSIPSDINISDIDFEEIQPDMLQRGLISQTYDEFADANDLAKTDD